MASMATWGRVSKAAQRGTQPSARSPEAPPLNGLPSQVGREHSAPKPYVSAPSKKFLHGITTRVPCKMLSQSQHGYPCIPRGNV